MLRTMALEDGTRAARQRRLVRARRVARKLDEHSRNDESVLVVERKRRPKQGELEISATPRLQRRPRMRTEIR